MECETNKARLFDANDVEAAPPEMDQEVNVRRGQKPAVNPVTLIVLVLLVANLMVGVIGLVSSPKSGVRTPAIVKAESIAMTKYRQELGRKNVKVTDEKIKTETYGSKKIEGYIENTGKDTLSTVSVKFKLYSGDEYVGTASDYVSNIEPGGKARFSASAYDVESFNSFETLPAEASDY